MLIVLLLSHTEKDSSAKLACVASVFVGISALWNDFSLSCPAGAITKHSFAPDRSKLYGKKVKRLQVST